MQHFSRWAIRRERALFGIRCRLRKHHWGEPGDLMGSATCGNAAKQDLTPSLLCAAMLQNKT